jgi:tetratricopeptide (TPR) repeat protein
MHSATSSESAPPTLPDEGELDPHGVARLLAEAWRDRRSGWLVLSQGDTERRIRVVEGAPTTVETRSGDDGFATRLEQAGLISGVDRAKVERVASERGCPQASAVLALRLMEPKALYEALRDATRAQLCESFEWPGGRYAWAEAEDEDEAASNARPHPILALLQRELPRRWGTDRLFQALMPLSEQHADLSPRFRKVAAKLAQAGEPARRAIAGLDGRVPLGRVLGQCAGDPLAASTLFTLFYAGALRLLEAGPARTEADPELEFEVEVIGGGESGASSETHSGVKVARRKKVQDGDQSEAMRQEILTLLENLADLDHYTALGLETDAKPGAIKKAYFSAAKRFHPDSLARLGLADLREQAARVFARIAEAFETLSDPQKRKAYDSGASGEPEIDTARLAQAEKSFRKGEILVRMGNFAGALEYLESAVDLWPEEPAYQAGLAWALFRQPRSDLERARTHFETAVRQKPDDALVLFRLGLVMRAAGESTRADELIARARAIDPSLEE